MKFRIKQLDGCYLLTIPGTRIKIVVEYCSRCNQLIAPLMPGISLGLLETAFQSFARQVFNTTVGVMTTEKDDGGRLCSVKLAAPGVAKIFVVSGTDKARENQDIAAAN